MKKRLTKIKKRIAGLEPPAIALWVNGNLHLRLLCTPVNDQWLVKINFVFLKDTAFISNKSRFDLCTDC